MKKYLSLACVLILSGCNNSVAETSQYHVVQMEEKQREVIKSNDPIIVTKVTSDGYVVKHGDHYHFVKGNVPSNAILQLDEKHDEDHYEFNPNDVVEETDEGYIVRHGDHYHYIPKENNHIIKINSQNHKEEPYVFNPNDIVRETDSGYIVKHGDHQHFIFKKDVSWYKPSTPKKTKPVQALVMHQNDFSKNLKEIEEYALKYNARKEEIKIRDNVIFIKHHDHYHVYSSELSNWDAFLQKYPHYKYDGEKHHHQNEEIAPLDEQDLIKNEQVKMMLNFELEKEEMDAPITKEDIKKLTTLELFGNDLEDYRFLKFAENLEKLDIGNNAKFKQSDLELLKNSKKLKVLKLRGNAAVNDITVLKDLPLEELWIDETGVGSLYQLKGFNHLKVLHAALLGAHDHEEGEEHDHSSKKHERHDELAKINSDVLSSMTALEELDISGSSLVDLSFTKNMKELKKLYVEGTYLSSISGLNTEKLEILKASGNEIKDVNVNASNLKEIDLSHNQINHITLNTPILKTLKLGGNNLKDIKLNLPKIEELHIQNNAITKLDFISNIKTLKSLQVQRNHIKDITAIKDLENLTSFDASYNEIEKVEALVNLTNLQQITLNHNRINDLSNVEELFKKDLFNLAIDEQEFEMQAVNNKIMLPASNLEYFNIKKEKLEQTELEINPQEETVIEFKHKNNKYNNSYSGKIKIRVQSN